MRVAEAVGPARWPGSGVGHVFGVVGSGNFHVTNALVAGGVPFVAARHEGGAATMADAYARTSAATVAVLTVHQGCGLTNAMTGITEAAKSRTPLLVLAADTAGAAVRSNFRIDQDALARAVGAVAERVHTPASAVADVVRAYRTAVRRAAHGGAQPAARRPGRAGRRAADPLPDGRAGARPRPDAARRWRRSPALLDGAERPVFVAGRGAAARRAATLRGARRARAARCSPPRRWRTACSPATRGRSASPAGSPRRWPPS